MTCLSIQQDGLKIYWRSDEGKTGTAMIDPSPPVIEGATASGLGLPPQPVGVEKALAAEQQTHQAVPAKPLPSAEAKTEPKTEPHERVAANPAPAAPARREAAPKPAVTLVSTHPVAIGSSFVREKRPQAEPPLAEAATPPLVELPREVMRPLLDQPEPSVARFAVAALVPMLPPAAPMPGPITANVADTDPFTAGREPMRHAAELVSAGLLEHRWCLANAFAKGPSLPASLAPAMGEAALEIANAPSLLAVAHEQSYEGELPLHEPACITEAPAIGAMARLIGSED